MNTEIGFSLLYPSVHLLLRTSKLAAAVSRRELLTWSIHPSNIRLFLYSAPTKCRVLLSVERLHRNTLKKKKIPVASLLLGESSPDQSSAVGPELADRYEPAAAAFVSC